MSDDGLFKLKSSYAHIAYVLRLSGNGKAKYIEIHHEKHIILAAGLARHEGMAISVKVTLGISGNPI